MSRIICQSTPKVKPTRTAPRKPGRFGAGLFAYTPHYRAEYTDTDYAWYLARVVAPAVDALPSGVELDRMAAEIEAVDRMSAGFPA